MKATTDDLWKKALLTPTAAIRDAIRNLDETSLRIVLAVDENGSLVGTLTDGDIRRGLIRGSSLTDSIASLINRNPFVVPKDMTLEVALRLMQANRIQQLPLVDERRRVIGLYVLDELVTPKIRPNLMVIMAGGKGVRLRPRTESCPKPLLPVGGKPMLQHIVERAKSEGFSRFVVATHYLGHMIEEFCGDGSQWCVKIDYLREQEPLGTVGAMGLLVPRPDAPFLISNGDVITDIRYGDLLDFHCRYGAAATMAVSLHEWQHPFGVVHTKGVDIVGFEEKPIARSHVNAGIYVLDPEALNVLVAGEYCDMPTLFERLKQRSERIIAYPMHEPWLDVGRPEEYVSAQAHRRGDTT